jgi:hypothetical protein
VYTVYFTPAVGPAPLPIGPVIIIAAIVGAAVVILRRKSPEKQPKL